MTPDTTPSGLTAAQITGLQMPTDVQVSLDGRLVAFTMQGVTRPKAQKHLPRAIWVAPADGSAPARRWTWAAANERAPRWSPDGRWLAFLSDRRTAGKAQVWRLPLDGGEGEQITDWAAGVKSFAWAPDGGRLAFTAADAEWAAESDGRDESGDDVQVWGERPGHHRLRLVAVGGGAVRTLSPADRHVTEFAWAPSGRQIVAALALRPDLEAPAEAGVDLVRFAADGGAPARVCHVPFGARGLIWTADEAAVLFTAWEAGAMPSSLAAFAVAGAGGNPRCLTRGMDGCVLGLLRPAAARGVLCLVAEGLTTRLYELDPESGRRTLRWQPPRGSADVELGADAHGRVLALRCSAGDTPPEVWAGDPAAGLRRISDCNPGLAGVRWAAQEPFTWTAPDGLALDGLVLRPPDVSGVPPGVVMPHGGPYSRWSDGHNGAPGNWNWGQWLALAGYAVFLPNPRGGMGHGHAFAATVAGEVGMADWGDVAAGTDAFVARGLADRERLGIGGWSQGGFMTAWAVSGGVPAHAATRGWSDGYAAWRPGSADRFRAGVAGAGPTDWGAMAAESDLPTFEAMLGGSRSGDGVGPHRHAVVSPISYAGRVRTPLLFLHGANDARVPIGQATGFFRELRRRGVPVELAAYPREGHVPEEEAHALDILARVRTWFGRWLR